MRIKNALSSEECNDLLILTGQVNRLILHIDKIAVTDDDALHEVNAHLREAQKILCMKVGATLNQTLLCAQDIEADTGEEVTRISRSRESVSEKESTDTTQDAK